MLKIIGEGFSTKKIYIFLWKKLLNSLRKFFWLFIKIQNKILFFLNEEIYVYFGSKQTNSYWTLLTNVLKENIFNLSESI